MDLSQCTQQQQQPQNQQHQSLTQLLDLANNYAAILTKLDFPLSIAPPNIIHEYLCNVCMHIHTSDYDLFRNPQSWKSSPLRGNLLTLQ